MGECDETICRAADKKKFGNTYVSVAFEEDIGTVNLASLKESDDMACCDGLARTRGAPKPE